MVPHQPSRLLRGSPELDEISGAVPSLATNGASPFHQAPSTEKSESKKNYGACLTIRHRSRAPRSCKTATLKPSARKSAAALSP